MTTPLRARCRCTLALGALTLAAAFAWPDGANARNDALARAQALYDAFRYDEAYTAYGEALTARGNTPDQLASIYLHLGITAASMDRPSEASEHFKRLLCLQPQAQLAEGVPPKVLGPFLVAQEAMRHIDRFRLGHTPPASRPTSGPLVLEFVLEPDGLGLASGVALRFREAGAASYAVRTRSAGGRHTVELTERELRPGRDVEYYLQVMDPHGGVLWEYGSESSPLVVRAAATEPAAVATSAPAQPDQAAARPDDDAAAGRPWYRQGWIWIVAGGAAALVVAGGATAAVAVAASQASNEPVNFGRVSYRIAGN